MKKMIAKDRVTLDACVKSMKDALSEGGNMYKSCLSLKKFTKDIEKKSKDHEDELASISQLVDPLSVSLSSHEDQVTSLLEKIRSLNHDKDRIIGRVGELRNWITPKLDIMLVALKDSQHALANSNLIDLKLAEAQAYLCSGLITILESLKKG